MLCKLPVAITIANRVSTVFLNMQRKYSVLTRSVTLWVVMLKTKKKNQFYLTYTGNKTFGDEFKKPIVDHPVNQYSYIFSFQVS